ncbi:MAG: glycosyltransferase [Muribaculaceae bacterium]|nr:glycosyltransferase [Muribaculaceae bacterium]
MSCSLHRDNVLEVLVCTRGVDGIRRVAAMNLPRVEGVGYLVSWQDGGTEVPRELCREDVKVVNTPTTGLSNNRNEAFRASTAGLLLVADDDLEYTAEGLKQVIAVMESHLDIDFATFKHSGDDNKWFPDYEFDLSTVVRNYYVTSFELAVRRPMVEGERAVVFDPQFGLGAPRFQACEEELFVMDAIRAGYRGRFFPIEIVLHHGLTTGYKPMTRGVLEAQGAHIGERYPWWSALPRIGVVSWRHYRAQRYSLLPAMLALASGWRAGRRENPNAHLFKNDNN